MSGLILSASILLKVNVTITHWKGECYKVGQGHPKVKVNFSPFDFLLMDKWEVGFLHSCFSMFY